MLGEGRGDALRSSCLHGRLLSVHHNQKPRWVTKSKLKPPSLSEETPGQGFNHYWLAVRMCFTDLHLSGQHDGDWQSKDSLSRDGESRRFWASRT